MAISSSLVLSPLRFNISSNDLSSSSLITHLFNVSTNTTIRLSSTILFSYKSSTRLAAEGKKKQSLESYDDYLSAPKRKREKEVQKQGVKEIGPEEEAKPSRMTHKLFQVLGGKAKRKKLLSPKGMDVRPTMEVVKGAVFGMLQPAGACPASLHPCSWLALCSSTGSVGIEAISQGCSNVQLLIDNCSAFWSDNVYSIVLLDAFGSLKIKWAVKKRW